MAAARSGGLPREPRGAASRGPAVAGIDLAAGAARVVVGRREESRLRIVGRGEAALPDGAVTAGLVADRDAVATALRNAFAAAEHLARAERICVALDSDDIRTLHGVTTFEREDSRAPVIASEESRAIREATGEVGRRAATLVEEDPALRGVPTSRLHDDVAALALDGRGLPSLAGHRGRLVEVWTDVTIAPLVLTGAVTAAFDAVRRRATVASGAYALGRLVAESGTGEAGIVRLGADVTAVAVVRERRVAATRVFALGRGAIGARPERVTDDARVWADCVVASLRGLDAPPPGRWLFVGVPETLRALPQALADAVGEVRGEDVDIEPLAPPLASRVYGDLPLRADDLVAAAAAALAAEVYAE